MKTVLFIGDDANQFALAEAISKVTTIDALVIRVLSQSRESTLKNIDLLTHASRISHRIRRSFLFPLNRAWFRMLKSYGSFDIAKISNDILYVSNVNEVKVFQLIDKYRPNLVLVSGTNLLSSKLISNIRENGEILNLHTGLSPYVNGGPNCTNWCLYLKKWSLIGNTIMFINEGIDSGDIVATECVDISSIKNLDELHLIVMEKAHSLFLSVIQSFILGKQLPRVTQDSIDCEKRTFYSKDWNILKESLSTLNFFVWRANLRKKAPLVQQNNLLTFPFNSEDVG